MDNPPQLDKPEPVVVPPDDTFRIQGDGGGAELLERSGIGPATWFLVDDATGQRVPASVTADSGGHICKNGVNFHLKPAAPLSPGDYTLVLLLAPIRWPLVEEEKEHTYKGERALVRRYRVEKAANQ